LRRKRERRFEKNDTLKGRRDRILKIDALSYVGKGRGGFMDERRSARGSGREKVLNEVGWSS